MEHSDAHEAIQNDTAVEQDTGDGHASDVKASYSDDTDAESSDVYGDEEKVEVANSLELAEVGATSPIILLPVSGLDPTHAVSPRAVRASRRWTTTASTYSTGCVGSVPLDRRGDSITDSCPTASGTPPAHRKRGRFPPDPSSSQKRQRAAAVPREALINVPVSEEQSPNTIAKWVAGRLGDSYLGTGNEPAQNSRSTLDSNPGQTVLHHRLPEQQGLVALDLNQLQDALENICGKILTASCRLMESVGEVDQEAMPLEQSAPLSTLELHVRCWGDEWRQTRCSLKKSNLFSVTDVVLSLCSAYLFDKVWNCLVWGTLVSLESDGKLISGFVNNGRLKARCPSPVYY